MDPTDLRAGLAERLASGDPIDAATFNAACFVLTRALDEISLDAPEAAPLVRRALRVAGRVVIDMASPPSSPEEWPNTRGMAVEWLTDALRDLGYEVRPKS